MSNEYLESNLKKSSMWCECVKIQVKYGEISEKCHNIRKALPVPFANILSWNWLALGSWTNSSNFQMQYWLFKCQMI